MTSRIAAIFVCLTSTAPIMGQLAVPDKTHLVRSVAETERTLRMAEAAAAEAKGQLARAKGDRKTAAAEWRKVVAYREGIQEAMSRRIGDGKICPNREDFEIASGAEVSVARVVLADIENDGKTLQAELPKAAALLKSRIEFQNRLFESHAISNDERNLSVRPLQIELDWIKDRRKKLESKAVR